MKANKIFAAAMAALALVGCQQKQDQPTSFELSETALQMKVGETHQLTTTPAVTVESWITSNEQVATVKDGLITALAEGNAIISATANGTTKTCVVAVKKDGGQQGGEASIEAKRIWAVVLDGVTAEANASIMAGDFRVNDVDNFLYIWASGETYAAGEGTGKNYFGNNEGYVSLTVVAPDSWSGLGFCISNDASIVAMQTLKEAIVANPDNFYLHLGLKATTPGNHQFYIFGTAETSFAVGTATIEAGQVIGDFTRDGAWHGFDVPMSQFAGAIANADVKAGINIFCALSGNQVGAQLNMDAIYFYEKK